MASTLQSLKASASGALPSFIATPLGFKSHAASSASSSKLLSALDYLSLPSLRDASPTTIAFTLLAIIATALVTEQFLYRAKKGGLPGPRWTIPIIGKFADSLNPSLEKYQAGWNSGPLSVASVFHM